MERYFYEGRTKKIPAKDTDGLPISVEVPTDGYCVFDRKHGHSPEQRLALCGDVADAEMIVAALNACVRNDA